jgi:hypothetical protein
MKRTVYMPTISIIYLLMEKEDSHSFSDSGDDFEKSKSTIWQLFYFILF